MEARTPFTHYRRRDPVATVNAYLKDSGTEARVERRGPYLVIHLGGRDYMETRPIVAVSERTHAQWLELAHAAERVHAAGCVS